MNSAGLLEIFHHGWHTGGGGARTRCYCWLIAWLLAWHSDGQTDIQTNGSTCSHGIFQKPRRRLSDFLSVRPVSLSDSLWRGADTRLFIFFSLVVHIFSRNIPGTSGRYLLGDLVVVVVAVEGLDGGGLVLLLLTVSRLGVFHGSIIKRF